MKKINDSRKLLGVTEKASLNELKSIYRNFMKEFHPDKFQEEQEKSAAEHKSKAIIEAYHFLVSINKETHEQNAEDYAKNLASNIADFEYHKQTLKVTFFDGSVYEYFDVPEKSYIKMVNADSPGRFAKRHIYPLFVFRNVSKANDVETTE
ncbi:MAG: KTSC domain-containing protein [Flavobacteriales bacterium]